jgi:hypothetical protein
MSIGLMGRLGLLKIGLARLSSGSIGEVVSCVLVWF